MSCAFPSVRGDPSPRTPLGLNTDKWLALADRVSFFHQPFDDLRGPRRRDRAFPAAGDDRAEVRGESDRGAGRGRVAAPRRRPERPRRWRDDQPPFWQVTVAVAIGVGQVLLDQVAGGVELVRGLDREL